MSNKLKLEQDEVKAFSLPAEETAGLLPADYDTINSSDMLDQFDFTKDESFDIDDNYEIVEKIQEIKEKDENLLKLNEAENIIRETAKKYLKEDFVDEWQKEKENLYAFLKKYSSEKDEVKSMTPKEKTKLFAISNYIFNNYQRKLNSIIYSFPLTRREYKFLYSVFNKIEYDQNEVFQMAELKEAYLDIHKDVDKKIPKEMEEIPTFININMLIILYHLVSKNKVKGIGDEFFTYKDLLIKIGERIKLFNAYNVIVERISKEFAYWVSTLEALDEELAGKSISETDEQK